MDIPAQLAQMPQYARMTAYERALACCQLLQQQGLAIPGWMQIRLDDLVQRLGVAYTRYADIRRYVIEPAVTELQAKSNLEITWEPVKTGRAVTSVRFEFTESNQGRLDL